jgi:hypothetical protein
MRAQATRRRRIALLPWCASWAPPGRWAGFMTSTGFTSAAGLQWLSRGSVPLVGRRLDLNAFRAAAAEHGAGAVQVLVRPESQRTMVRAAGFSNAPSAQRQRALDRSPRRRGIVSFLSNLSCLGLLDDDGIDGPWMHKTAQESQASSRFHREAPVERIRKPCLERVEAISDQRTKWSFQDNSSDDKSWLARPASIRRHRAEPPGRPGALPAGAG